MTLHSHNSFPARRGGTFSKLNNTLFRSAWVCVLSLLFLTPLQAQSLLEKKEDKPKDATQIVSTIRSRVPTQAIESQGVLRVRAPKKETRYVPVRFTVKPLSRDSWESVYETQYESAPQERLTIQSSPLKPNVYQLSRKASGEAEWETRTLSPGEETAVSFAGTDFWACDLGLEFLHWPKQSLLKREMRKGRPCRVIESTPAQRQGAMYARVVSWVDNESDGIVMAQSYNEGNKRVKEFEVQSFQKVNGVWQLKRMTIYDNATDSRTTLEIDLEVEDSSSTSLE